MREKAKVPWRDKYTGVTGVEMISFDFYKRREDFGFCQPLSFLESLDAT